MHTSPKRMLFTAIGLPLLLGIIVGIWQWNRKTNIAASSLFANLAAQASTTRPNVVVLMADDLDVESLQAMLYAGLAPNIQKYLVNEGVEFKNSFVTNSLCCPSRATFLTGQYTHNNKVFSNEMPFGTVYNFKDASTLSVWLKNAGYYTGFIGKYLNGYGLVDVNHDKVFDLKDILYIPPGWNDWEGLIDLSTYVFYGYKFNDNGRIVQYGSRPEDYQTDVIAKRMERFINGRVFSQTPFFLWATPVPPHVEVTSSTRFNVPSDLWKMDQRVAQRYDGTVNFAVPQKPSHNEADVSDKPAWVKFYPQLTTGDETNLTRQYRHRLEAIRALDDLVGTTVKALVRTGKLDNTIFIFTADNGFLYGEHRLSEKQYAYEESARVPLFVRMPGLPSGFRTQIALNMDLAPTILELTQAPKPSDLIIDGTSFVFILKDGLAKGRTRFLIEHYRARDHWSDVPTYGALRWIGQNVGDLLYVNYQSATQTPELYDLSGDPYQLASLHNDTSTFRQWEISVMKSFLGPLQVCAGTSCQNLEFWTSTSTSLQPNSLSYPAGSLPVVSTLPADTGGIPGILQ